LSPFRLLSVATSPGLIDRNKIPSSFSAALYFAITTLAAALLTEYGVETATSTALMRLISAIPVEILTTFLISPFFTKGRKACTVLTRPRTLTWKEERKSCFWVSGLDSLHTVQQLNVSRDRRDSLVQ
jgi:hypothetical protein